MQHAQSVASFHSRAGSESVDTAHFRARQAALLERLDSRLSKSATSILPDDLEAKRASVEVMPELLVKTHPAVDLDACIQASRGRDEKNIFDRLVAPFRLSPEITHGGTSLLYVDKMRPHAKLDMMVTQADEKIAPRLEDLSLEARFEVVRNIVGFMNYSQEAGLTPVCSYSIDPLTFDRKSAQSSKRFHVHFVGREWDEVQQINNEKKRLATLDPFTQRRLVDETAILLSMALADKLSSMKFDGIEGTYRPFEGGATYPFFKLYATKPTSEIEVARLAETLSRVHQTYESVYGDLHAEFFDGASGRWSRPRKIDFEHSPSNHSIDYLSSATRGAILGALDSFSNRLLDLVERVQPAGDLRALTSHVYPNACPAYSVTMTNQNPEIIEIIFRPFLFSDTGGAGLSSLSNIVVKTKKADEERMNADEMADRRKFQAEALRHMGVIGQR